MVMNEQRSQTITEWQLPKIDLERCTACGECVTVCTANALEMQGQSPVFSSPSNCTYCTDCEALCLSGAIACEFDIIWDIKENP